MTLSRIRDEVRRNDTHTKIELGGLVVKVGLVDEERSVILGALIEIANALKGPDGEATKAKFRAVGDKAFKE